MGYSVSHDPSILADNVTGVSARGLSTVKLTCSVENPVDGLSLSATCDGTVVTEAEVIDGVVLYSVAQNVGEARDGSITLTYGAINKTITVSQLAPVFKVARTEVELEAAANSSSTIIVTSDFDWVADASEGAGFTYDPTVCEWTDASYASAKGKITVTITATAANASKEGTKTLGTLTFTNLSTEETLVVTVTQKTSYVAPSTGTKVTLGSDWNALFGTLYSGSISGIKANEFSLNGSSNDVSIAVANGTSTNGYVKTSDFRAYNGYTITLSVPKGKNITAISTTKGGKSFTSGISANVGNGSISSSAYSWSGSSQTVVLSITGTVSFATIVVTYE